MPSGNYLNQDYIVQVSGVWLVAKTFFENSPSIFPFGSVQLGEIMWPKALFTCNQPSSLCTITLQWIRGTNTAISCRLILTSVCHYIMEVIWKWNESHSSCNRRNPRKQAWSTSTKEEKSCKTPLNYYDIIHFVKLYCLCNRLPPSLKVILKLWDIWWIIVFISWTMIQHLTIRLLLVFRDFREIRYFRDCSHKNLNSVIIYSP